MITAGSKAFGQSDAVSNLGLGIIFVLHQCHLLLSLGIAIQAFRTVQHGHAFARIALFHYLSFLS
jgi:hypothetical protein